MTSGIRAALRGDDGEVQRGAGRVHVRNVAQHKGGRARFGQRGGQRRRSRPPSARRCWPSWSPFPGSRTALRRPAARRAGTARRTGRAPTPAPGASPSDVPPWATSTARVSACRLSVCSAVPSNTVIARQPPVICCSPIVLGGGQVDAGLGLVGQSDHGGAGTGLRDGPQRRRRRSRSRGTTTPRSGGLGDRVHPQPHPGDDAEHALGPDEQLAQVGTRRRRRGAPRGRGCPSGSPPAVRGPCRRTGRNPRSPAPTTGSPRSRRWSRTRSSAGSARARSRARRAVARRRGPVHPRRGRLHRSRRRGSMSWSNRRRSSEMTASNRPRIGVEPADHAGAPAERHDGDPLLGAVPQHVGDLVVGTRE